MIKKGRQAKGEGKPSAILTEDQVIEIRKRYKPRRMSYRKLAIEFGVGDFTIERVVKRINWKHL
jgi:hypothetical protein